MSQAQENPVILNPDAFVRSFQEPISVYIRRKNRRLSRILASRRPHICESCIIGVHDGCESADCPCIHHEMLEFSDLHASLAD